MFTLRKNLSLNVIESIADFLVIICFVNEMVRQQQYQLKNIAFGMTAIILNIPNDFPLFSCKSSRIVSFILKMKRFDAVNI